MCLESILGCPFARLPTIPLAPDRPLVFPGEAAPTLGLNQTFIYLDSLIETLGP